MKKIRAIIVALLCLTIGGVYATWTFADDANIDRKGESISITLADKATTSEVLGTLSIEKSDDFAITIDQKREANPAEGITADHTAVIKITGTITLRFKANANAGTEIRENGVKAIYYFAASNLEYDDDSDAEGAKSIYNIDTATQYTIDTLDSASEVKWSFDDATKTFFYVITNEELVELIKINTFVIDDSTEYAAFNEVLRDGTVSLYLNDFATPNA